MNTSSGHAHDSEKNTYEPSAYSFKRVIFDGVSLYTSEFSTEEREFSSAQQVISLDFFNCEINFIHIYIFCIFMYIYIHIYLSQQIMMVSKSYNN